MLSGKKLNRILSAILKPDRGISHQLRKAYLLSKARLSNRVFHCRALAGDSSFNICINCDMTVSCNCQDFDGKGRIGDLKRETLAQVFSGDAARAFRSALASRKFPVPVCPVCADLVLVPRNRAGRLLNSFHPPAKGIMIENTALCNLRCNTCRRDELLEIRGKKFLSLEDVEKIALMLAKQDVETVYYFNLGEPFLPDNINEQVSIIRKHNPGIKIITSTNGVLLDTEEKLEAALMMDYVYISLDGVNQATVTRYQAGSNFDKAYQNMNNLLQMRESRGARRPIIEWKYVLFRWNDKPTQIDQAIELAKSAGVDIIAFYPGAAPIRDKSFRYYLHPYFQKLGEKTGQARAVNFHGISREQLSP